MIFLDEMDGRDIGFEKIVGYLWLRSDKGAAAGDAGRGIDKIGRAQVDEHRPTALQERRSVASGERRGGDAPGLQRRDHLRAGAEL